MIFVDGPYELCRVGGTRLDVALERHRLAEARCLTSLVTGKLTTHLMIPDVWSARGNTNSPSFATGEILQIASVVATVINVVASTTCKPGQILHE